MAAASQSVIDSVAVAIAQERLDRRHIWRQIAGKVSGLPDVERNVIKFPDPQPITNQYYDIIPTPPTDSIKITNESGQVYLPQRQQQPIQQQPIQQQPIQQQPIQQQPIQQPQVVGSWIQQPQTQQPIQQQPIQQPKSNTLRNGLLGLGAAGLIGAVGLAGYMAKNNKPDPQTTTVESKTLPEGDLLQELRKRGYHLRRTE